MYLNGPGSSLRQLPDAVLQQIFTNSLLGFPVLHDPVGGCRVSFLVRLDVYCVPRYSVLEHICRVLPTIANALLIQYADSQWQRFDLVRTGLLLTQHPEDLEKLTVSPLHYSVGSALVGYHCGKSDLVGSH